MLYAKVVNGVVEKFPYTYGELRADNPNTSFPSNPAELDLDAWDIEKVYQQADPAYDDMTQRLEQGTPVFVDPQWQVTQVIVQLTQEEVDDKQAESDLEEDRALFSSDPDVKALLGARSAQIENYIDNNVTDLTSAKEILKILAKANAILAQALVN